MARVTWPRPFQEQFAIRGLALATINLSTKFEIFIFTHYEDAKKGDTKDRNKMVWVRGITQGH